MKTTKKGRFTTCLKLSKNLSMAFNFNISFLNHSPLKLSFFSFLKDSLPLFPNETVLFSFLSDTSPSFSNETVLIFLLDGLITFNYLSNCPYSVPLRTLTLHLSMKMSLFSFLKDSSPSITYETVLILFLDEHFPLRSLAGFRVLYAESFTIFSFFFFNEYRTNNSTNHIGVNNKAGRVASATNITIRIKANKARTT